MDKAGANFEYATSTIVNRLGARAVPIQIPIGEEAKFAGVVDLVEMRGILWHDETMGAKYDVEEIPADLQEKAEEMRDQLIEAVADSDDEVMNKYLEGEEITVAELKRAHPQGDDRDEHLPGAVLARRSRTRACRRCWMRWSTTCRARWMCRRSRASNPENLETEADPQGGRQRAVCGARLQDHDRPVCRPADLYPRVLGHAEDGRLGAESAHAEDGAHRPSAEDARQQARRDHGDPGRRYLRGGGSQEPGDGRHDLHGEGADRA